MTCGVEHGRDLVGGEAAGTVRVVDIRGRRVAAVVTPVLADPSGVRARRLARLGRGVACLCLLWLLGLGLAGIGILPARDLPLDRVLAAPGPEKRAAAPAPRPRRLDLASERTATSGAVAVAGEGVSRGASGPRSISSTSRPGGATGFIASAPSGFVRGRSPGRAAMRGRVTSPSAPAAGVHRTGSRGLADAAPTDAAPIEAGTGSSQTAAASVTKLGTHPTAAGTTRAPGRVKSAAPGHTSASASGHSAAAPGQVPQTTATATAAPGQSGTSPGHTITPGGGHGNGT